MKVPLNLSKPKGQAMSKTDITVIAATIVRRHGYKVRNLTDHCYRVSVTKRLARLSPQEQAEVAVNRARESFRVLAHETGAEGWL